MKNNVRQTVPLGDILEHDEILAIRLTGDRFEFTQAQILPDADDDHLYVGVARPRRSRNRLIRRVRLAGGQQDPDAPVTAGELSGTVGLREPVESHLVDGFVSIGVACFLPDVVDGLENVLLGRVSVQVKLALGIGTVETERTIPHRFVHFPYHTDAHNIACVIQPFG